MGTPSEVLEEEEDVQSSLPTVGADNNPSMQAEDRQRLLDGQSPPFKATDRLIQPTRCRGCTVIVEPMLFLFMLSQFPMTIIMPQYIQRREWQRLMGNESYPTSTNTCHPHTDINNSMMGYDPIKGNLTLASSAASLFGLQASLVGALPAIVSVMFLGPYSDVVGRRYALIIPIIGQTVASANTLLNEYFNLPLELLLVGSFIYGCCGYWVTLFMGAISYITDITSKERRSFRIVMAEICVFAPTIISSAGSGFWIQHLGFLLVFLIVFCFNIIILLYTIFLIPETIRRDPSATLFSLKYVKKAITVFAVDNSSRRRWKLLMLLLIILLSTSMMMGGVETYFVMNLPLCWGSVTIGIYMAISIAVSVFGSTISSLLLSLRFRDAWIVVVVLSFSTSGNIYKFFVDSTPMMLGSTAFNCMAVVGTPTIRAMLSKLVEPTEVGAVFSGVAVVEVLCGMVGSLLLLPIYSATAKTGHPSAIFLVMAAVFLATFTLMLIYAILTRNRVKGSRQVTDGQDDEETFQR